MIAKTMIDEYHLVEKIFERPRKNDLKLNPRKCMIGATLDKFLDFIIKQCGTEIDRRNQSHYRNANSKNRKELKGFLGCLKYIDCFITQMTITCELLFELLRKNTLVV